MDKVFEILFARDCGLGIFLVLDLFLRIESGSERAHKSRDVASDNLDAHFLLKRSEYGVVEEGAALNDNPFAELTGRGRADNLVQGVLYDGERKSRRDILDCRAVLLSLLYRGIHKHGTARAQIYGALRENPLVREVLDRIAEGVREGLQKASAARGARFV